jgi:molybdopterin synthase sulfur carrier subunit
MIVKLVYLARLREAFARSEEELPLPEGGCTVSDLLARLRERGGAWADELAPSRAFRVAVNQDMAAAATRIVGGDEVAIFPPVTGG